MLDTTCSCLDASKFGVHTRSHTNLFPRMTTETMGTFRATPLTIVNNLRLQVVGGWSSLCGASPLIRDASLDVQCKCASKTSLISLFIACVQGSGSTHVLTHSVPDKYVLHQSVVELDQNHTLVTCNVHAQQTDNCNRTTA